MTDTLVVTQVKKCVYKTTSTRAEDVRIPELDTLDVVISAHTENGEHLLIQPSPHVFKKDDKFYLHVPAKAYPYTVVVVW